MLQAPAHNPPQRHLRLAGAAAIAAPALDRIDRRAHPRLGAGTRTLRGLGQARSVVVVQAIGSGIGAVHLEVPQQGHQPARQHLRAELAGQRIQVRGGAQRLHGAHELGLQRALQDLVARGALFLAEVAAAPAPAPPQRGQRFGAGRVVQHRGDLVHEVVAGGAVAGPVAAQLLVRRQDLFQVQGDAARGDATAAAGAVQLRAQPLHVAGGVGQAIDMVNPHAIEMALGDQPQRQLVDRGEHVVLLHAQRRQRGDVEEAAVVEHVVADPPPGQAIALAFDQPVQGVVAQPRGVVEPGRPGRARAGRFLGDGTVQADREALVVVQQDHAAVLADLQLQRAFAERLRIGAVQHRQP